MQKFRWRDMNRLDEFKPVADVIVAKRLTDQQNKVQNKVCIRDLSS